MGLSSIEELLKAKARGFRGFKDSFTGVLEGKYIHSIVRSRATFLHLVGLQDQLSTSSFRITTDGQPPSTSLIQELVGLQ